MKNSISIISSRSIKILENNDLEVLTNTNQVGICKFSEVSDFPVHNIYGFFNTYPSYKFKIIGKNLDDGTLKLSYKQCHPKLCKNKRKIISTANHYKTLKRYVTIDIEEYFKNK